VSIVRQLWASGSLPADARADTDIETTLSSWGTGNNVTTKLCNPAGEVSQSVSHTLVVRFVSLLSSFKLHYITLGL